MNADKQNLIALTQSEGWKVVVKELTAEIEVIENNLFTTWDNTLKYSEQDLLRNTRLIYKAILDCPEDTIALFNS